jgi:hypothetical protein
MNPLYVVNKCEDTGRLALYKVVDYASGKANILVEHEDYFWDVYSVLAKHFERRAKGPGLPGV